MRILAIDPGSSLGWATNATGKLEWGTENFRLRPKSTEAVRWHRFREWFARMVGPDVKDIYIVYEEQNSFNRGNTAGGEIGKTFAAFMLEFCHARGIPCEAIPNTRLKSFAIPARPRPKRGEPKNPPLDRSKDAMIEAATRRTIADGRGPSQADGMTPPLSEHEADALWLYWYALDQVGGSRRIA